LWSRSDKIRREGVKYAWPSSWGGSDSAGVSGGGFGASRSVCGRRRGVSLGSCFERSGGLTGIAESGSGVAEGILMCCCFRDGTVRKRVWKLKAAAFTCQGWWRGSCDFTLTLMVSRLPPTHTLPHVQHTTLDTSNALLMPIVCQQSGRVIRASDKSLMALMCQGRRHQ
jgi:hypothetical protein